MVSTEVAASTKQVVDLGGARSRVGRGQVRDIAFDDDVVYHRVAYRKAGTHHAVEVQGDEVRRRDAAIKTLERGRHAVGGIPTVLGRRSLGEADQRVEALRRSRRFLDDDDLPPVLSERAQ